MSQALYTSKTGIAAGQTQIDVIANNVANINTTAYKTANVTFSTLFSKTLSNGSAATTKGGGTNPRQIGLGTQVAAISRDFNPGSFQQTGISSDMMISGNGYFVVRDGAENQFFTRDGHFSLDNEGNLVTASGLKVTGTINEYTTISSPVTIKVPTMLNVSVFGTSVDKIKTIPLGEMNAVTINTGSFRLNVGGTSTSVEANRFEKQTTVPPSFLDTISNNTYTKIDMSTLNQEDRSAMTELFGALSPTDTYYATGSIANGTRKYIKGEINWADPDADAKIKGTGTVAVRNMQQYAEYKITDGDLNSTLDSFITAVNNEFASQGHDIKLIPMNGGIQLDNNTGKTISVAKQQTSNFLVQTGLSDAIEAAEGGQTTFYGVDMHKSAVIGNSYNSASAIKRSDWSISEGGVISASYNDGSFLTVALDSSGRGIWQYTTSDNVVITGSGNTGSDIDMSSTGMTPANMILQIGTVVNDSGLIAQVDNLWKIGPNAGEFAYGMSNGNGFGSLKSGGLEGSNVDMATELSNMITAQRAIQVNSRVFSTASSILETLAYLGQR